jgi:putative (di)nucleoside polyphosphate hydrolase
MTESAAPAGDRDYRPGVGIMLLNQQGDVFVARRLDLPGEAWQMPQGGIDHGEEPKAAALRELAEETGIGCAEILAESSGWLRYDLPEELTGRAWRGRWRGQRQKWFLMRFTGSDGDIDLTTHKPEFDAWKWVPARELPRLAAPFKRQVYCDLLVEFRSLLAGLGGAPS